MSHAGVFIVLFVISASFCYGERVMFTLNNDQIIRHEMEPWEHYKEHSRPWVVVANYTDSYDKTGWALAEFTMNPEIDAPTLAYTAGYAEGALTKTRIDQQWNNTIGSRCQGSPLSKSCEKLHAFLQDNMVYMKTMIKDNPGSRYWKEVRNVLLQVQGLVDGYSNKDTIDLTIRLEPFGFLLFQLGGDLEDLEVALGLEKYFSRRVVGSGSCSALIKMVKTENGEVDLLSAHDTWSDYNGMLRIMKRFNFPQYSEAYSGYPGSIFSGDDFYIMSSGLVTMETTNGNGNSALWKYVTPHSVLDWIRNLVANRIAHNGNEWCSIFAQYNSGTYNNQWMIIDYNKFQANANSEILYVLEQLPGLIESKDVTNVLLEKTYWASYNIPYFETIFNASDQPAMVKKYGDWFTYDKNPRARMFARDHDNVKDLTTLLKLMRYNDFKQDPISKCNCTPPYSAENTIAARSDLNDPNGQYPFAALGQRNHGAVDVKVTSAALMRSYSMVAESGPTHDQQTAFQWSISPYAETSHVGHPDKFEFKPELIVWGK